MVLSTLVWRQVSFSEGALAGTEIQGDLGDREPLTSLGKEGAYIHCCSFGREGAYEYSLWEEGAYKYSLWGEGAYNYSLGREGAYD